MRGSKKYIDDLDRQVRSKFYVNDLIIRSLLKDPRFQKDYDELLKKAYDLWDSEDGKDKIAEETDTLIVATKNRGQ